MGETDSFLKSLACPEMNAPLIVKLTHFTHFESNCLIKMYSFSDKPKTQKVSHLTHFCPKSSDLTMGKSLQKWSSTDILFTGMSCPYFSIVY